jgi:hypothetical protein
MRKLWEFFKRSLSSPKRGRSREQRPSSSTSAASLPELRIPTRNTSDPTLPSASHPSETLPARLHSPAYAMPFSSAPALVQTSSPVSAPPAHLPLPFSHCPPSLPTSPLPPSDTPLSSNIPHVPPVITTTFARTSHSSRPSTASSMAASTRSTPPRIRIDRNASPARPETRNNVAPFISNPALLAPKPIERSTFASPPLYSDDLAGRRMSHIPGGTRRSHIPGGIGRNFVPGTGDVGIGSGIGMGSGMGLAGITSSSRSRPGSSGSTSSRRERRQSTYRGAGVPSVFVDAGVYDPFARSGSARRTRANAFE